MPHQCPLVTFFATHGKCNITTCQHNTPVTNTGCLLRDRQESSNGITDTELLFYKIQPKKESFGSKSLDSRFANYVRKKAETAAKSNMIFAMYYEFVLANHKQSPRFIYVSGKNKFIDDIMNSFPFVQEGFEFESWTLPFLAQPKTFKAFLEKQKRKITEKISLINVLGLTPGKYKNLCHALKNYHTIKKG